MTTVETKTLAGGIAGTVSYMMDRKMWAGGLAGGVAMLLVWFVQARFGITIPTEMANAIVLGAAGAVGYIVPPSVKDIVKRIDGTIVEIVNKDPNIPLVKGGPPVASGITAVNGMTGKPLSLLLGLMLILPLLGACTKTSTVESAAPVLTTKPIIEAAQAVKSLPDEEKWRYACLGADGIYTGYLLIAAPKLSDSTNVKVQAGYDAVKVVCAERPANYAEGLITLAKAISAFKAAIPTKAS